MHLVTRSQRSRLVRDNQRSPLALELLNNNPKKLLVRDGYRSSHNVGCNCCKSVASVATVGWHGGGNVIVDRRARRGRTRGDVLIWSFSSFAWRKYDIVGGIGANAYVVLFNTGSLFVDRISGFRFIHAWGEYYRIITWPSVGSFFWCRSRPRVGCLSRDMEVAVPSGLIYAGWDLTS